MVSINELTNCDTENYRCDVKHIMTLPAKHIMTLPVKHIMTLPIKTITSVLNIYAIHYH